MKAKISKSIRLTMALLREQALPMLGIFIIGCILNLLIEDAMQLQTAAQETQRWVMQLILGLWECFQGIMIVLILSWGLPKVHAFKARDLLKEPFATPYIGSFLAEYLRYVAQILMWGLLLILPGFYRYCQLIFVPYIALFSKSYRDGEVDALKTAEVLVKGNLAKVFGIQIFAFLSEIGIEFLPQMVPDLHTLFMRIVFQVISFVLPCWVFAILFLLFESALEARERT